MFDLGGKTALVTGASGGIGGSIAKMLHGAGAQKYRDHAHDGDPSRARASLHAAQNRGIHGLWMRPRRPITTTASPCRQRLYPPRSR